MSLYTDVASKVATIIAQLGQTGQVQKPTPVLSGGGPTDPTGGTPGVAPDPVSANMAIFPMMMSTSRDRIDGTSILETDFQVIVEPVDGGIDEGDKIICSEGTLTIVNLGKIAPEGTIVAYDMICRG